MKNVILQSEKHISESSATPLWQMGRVTGIEPATSRITIRHIFNKINTISDSIAFYALGKPLAASMQSEKFLKWYA